MVEIQNKEEIEYPIIVDNFGTLQNSSILMAFNGEEFNTKLSKYYNFLDFKVFNNIKNVNLNESTTKSLSDVYEYVYYYMK